MLLLFCLSGATIGLGLPPHFKAEGVLVIYSQPQRVADVQEVLPDPATDLPAIRSELDVLRSRSLIEQVVRSLALWRRPEFQSSSFPGGWNLEILRANLRALWQLVDDRASIGLTSAAAHPSPDVAGSPSPAQIQAAISKYAAHLTIENDGQSMTMQIFFTAWTPELAAVVVNSHMAAYLELRQHAKAAAAERANAWLNVQIVKLRGELQTAEGAVAEYRVQHRLTGAAKDHDALSQQLAALTAQLIAARADLAENEARAAEVRARIAGKGGAGDGPEVTTSHAIEELRREEALAIEREASLSTEFGGAYPPLQQIRSSLRDLRRHIARESSRNYAAALDLVERKRAREQSIERSVLALTEQVNSSDAGLRQLQENAESIRSLLARFQKRMEETAAQPAFITANASIVTSADALAAVRSPITLSLAIGGAFGGLIVGVLAAAFIERRDRTFYTSMQVGQDLEPRTIAVTPRALGRGRKAPTNLIVEDHGSVFAEAFRVSWANIQLAIQGPEASGMSGVNPKIVLGITSATTGEGKSTHALAFARTAALAGESVALVDADLRRSGVSRLIEATPELTLRDFLGGRCAAGDVVAFEPSSGMHFISSTPVERAWSSSDFRRFGELIRYLRTRFDAVIIDLPPVLGLSETVRLATVTDGVALIIRWGRTDRELARLAFSALRSVGVTATTAILNDIDLRAQLRRGYHDRSLLYAYDGANHTS
jgi:uncharacterized protein involved in exopolysaccharide biosynthesis/Mrp family chromosome partitioning ATPase